MIKRTLRDGHINHDNMVVAKAPDHQSKYTNFGLYKAEIIESIPKGDKRNRWKKGVEYKARIIGGKRDGEVLHGLVPLCGFGGQENFNEVVYKPKSKIIRGSNKGDKTPSENTDGSQVVVAFLNGHYNFPIILSGWAQPNNSQYGAKSDDGVRILGQFQGLKWNIDKSGKMTISNGGTSIAMNGSDVTITTTGKATINSTGNTTVSSSGKVDITSTAPTTLNAPTVSLVGGSINLGSLAPADKMFLGSQLMAIFNAHTHVEHDGPVTSGPTPTLTNAAASNKIKIE